MNLFGEVVEEPEVEEEEFEREIVEKEFGEYTNPIGITSQFRFCGNPLRADTYRGCTFGCSYCFANARNSVNAGMFQRGAGPANLSQVIGLFKKAYGGEATRNANVECLRRGVPLHLGGMSDPFQARERHERNTLKFLQITEQYRYPILISTKAAGLLPEHWEMLNPERHAFQISLISTDENWIRQWEANTPKPGERIAFIRALKEKGFWVGVRIQPLVDLDQALNVVKETRQYVDYFTVEHLKLPMDNIEQRAILTALLGDSWRGLFVMVSRSAEMRTSVKVQNLERIKEAAQGVLVGAGDNDLHHLSDSRCCCGVDTIGPVFGRWMKYNSTYFDTAPADETLDKEHIWSPTAKIGGCFIGGKSDPCYFLTFRERTDAYCEELGDRYSRRNAQMTIDEYLALEEAAKSDHPSRSA